MSYQIKQSTTAQPLLFLMLDSADHVTGKTGLTPTVTIRKPGGSFATPAGAVTEIANGWYQVAGNATDTGTLGPLLLHATASGADPCDDRYEVVAFDPQDSVRAGLTALPNAAAGASGGLPLGDASGNVAANVTQTGTAQAGASTTITLATSASTTINYYSRQLVQIVSGTGAGQVRQIVSYSTGRVATVNYAWQTNPDNTSVYRVIVDHIPFSDSGGTVWAYNHAGAAIATITALSSVSTLIGTPNVDVSTDLAAVGGNVLLVKAKTDIIPASPAATGDVTTVGTAVAAVSTKLGTPAGASVSADIAAVKAETALIVADTGTDGVLLSASALTSLADSVCDEALSGHTTSGTVGASLANVYAAQIDYVDDDTNDKDEFTVQWFCNGAPVTNGITSPTIQVIKRADGTDLVAATSMTQIGSTGAYKYDEATNRISAGEAVVVQVQATIDGAARTWRKVVGRDDAA